MHRRRDIDRYLAEGLPPDLEQALRQHLVSCAECRRFYDEEVQLRRVLAGAPTEPTRAEEARLQRLVFARANLQLPSFEAAVQSHAKADRTGARAWRFALPIGAAALALLVGLWIIHPFRTAPVSPQALRDQAMESALAAHFTQAKAVTMDGVSASPGASLRAGVLLSVAADGLAELELVRGGRVHLFPGARLKLSPRGEAIALDDGKVWCEVDAGRGRFAVQTERGEARVLGTSFVVERLPSGDTDVRVLGGVVEVEDVGHRGIVRVSSGERTQLSSSAPPVRVARYDTQSDRSEWEQDLKRLGREIERTFRKLGDKLRHP